MMSYLVIFGFVILLLSFIKKGGRGDDNWEGIFENVFSLIVIKWTFNFFNIFFRWWDWKNCYWTNLRYSVQWLTRCNCKYFCVINRVYARHSILRSLLSLSLSDILIYYCSFIQFGKFMIRWTRNPIFQHSFEELCIVYIEAGCKMMRQRGRSNSI